MTDSSETVRVGKKTVAAVLAAAALVVLAASWRYLTDGQSPYGDDNSAHFALMMHIADLWRGGVTDLWWNQANLGLPLFLAYQPLPALASGTVAALFEGTAARLFIYKFSVVGMWALMPAAWYVGGRWLGLDRLQALLFGLFTLAIHDLHDVGFAFTAASYGGLYTQIWGMFFFPVTVGAFRRYAVDRDLPLVVPVTLFVVLSLSHLFCGMYAGIATLMWVVVAGADERVGQLKRALKVYLPALALLAFWLGPLVATSDLIGGLPWKNEYYNGWPVVELFRHLLGGDVFDDGRIPWLTVLAGAGVFWTLQEVFGGAEERGGLAARAPGMRWMLALSALSLILFMGRTNFGSLYNLLPMHESVNVMRYINAIHFCGLLFAAVAGARLVRWGDRRIAEYLPAERAGWVALGAVVLLAGLYGSDRYGAVNGSLKTYDQTHPNVRALVDDLADEPGQRFAVSDALNTAPHFYRDLLPALSGRGQVQSYALGYHATLSTYYADYFHYNSTWARLFNAGAFVAREPFKERVVEGLDKTFEQGPFSVWEPTDDDFGYFDFVRTPLAVDGGYHDIRPAVRRLLVPGFKRRALPVLRGPTDASKTRGGPVLSGAEGAEPVAWSGDNGDAWVDYLEAQTPDEPIDSRVVDESRGPNWYQAEVEATGGGERLMLKANYFPFWQATVDRNPVEIDHIAPNFMAVDVPEGSHTVRFVYYNPWWQKLGALLTLFTLIFWSAWRWQTTRD